MVFSLISFKSFLTCATFSVILPWPFSLKLHPSLLRFLVSSLYSSFHKQNKYFIHCLLSVFPFHESNLHEVSYFNLLCSLLFSATRTMPRPCNHSINIGPKINSWHPFMLLLFMHTFGCFIHISFSTHKNTIKAVALPLDFTEGKTVAEFE